MAEQTARDAKLVQYLSEAYTTEKHLETALEAHIAMAKRDSYKKRLRQHLSETKRHAREVEKRIKKLGGTGAFAEVATTAQSLAGKAMAAAQGPLHAVRGTSEQEIQLKNARTEYASEAEEIATYTAIATLAASVGDSETEKLAKAILREEERMAKFLERLIPTLTKAVVTSDIPAAERRGTGRRRSRSGGSRGSSASSRRSSSRSSSGGSSGSRRSRG